MAEIEDGIRDLLVAAGDGVFAAASGWGIFIGPEPTVPDTSITIREFSAGAPMPKWLIDFPSAQVMIRGASGGYQLAKLKARDVLNTLHSIPSQDLNGDRWDGILALSGPGYLGVDDNNRPKFSINFRLIIEPAAGTNRIPL